MLSVWYPPSSTVFPTSPSSGVDRSLRGSYFPLFCFAFSRFSLKDGVFCFFFFFFRARSAILARCRHAVSRCQMPVEMLQCTTPPPPIPPCLFPQHKRLLVFVERGARGLGRKTRGVAVSVEKSMADELRRHETGNEWRKKKKNREPSQGRIHVPLPDVRGVPIAIRLRR